MGKFKTHVPYDRRPFCFFDVETTGLDAGYHELTEIGFIHDKLGSANIQIRPKHLNRAQQKALDISGFQDDSWAEADDFHEVIPKIVEYMEDAILVGHNAIKFDLPMVLGNFEMYGYDTDRISKAVIDTQVLALTHLVPQGLKLLGLKPCMKFLNIEMEDHHTAYDDALMTKHVYEGIMKKVMWTGGSPQQTLF